MICSYFCETLVYDEDRTIQSSFLQCPQKYITQDILFNILYLYVFLVVYEALNRLEGRILPKNLVNNMFFYL